MNGSIHSTAIIAASANIHPQTSILPYSCIGENVVIDQGCRIGPHAVIEGPAAIGKNNRIFQFTSLGEEPQHTQCHGRTARLVIGDDNIFRESCTVHRGTLEGGGVTTIGNKNFFLANVHIAHDCTLGHHNILVNNTSLGGHVHLGNHVTLSGHTGVHQCCRIGDHAFVGRCAMVVRDVPPFTLSAGNEHRVHGLNTIGLRRKGFKDETIRALKKAYRIYYRCNLSPEEALRSAELPSLCKDFAEVRLFVQFIRASQRGVIR